MNRKIRRRRERSRDPPPEFALLRSSPAQQDSRIQRRFRLRGRPETASSWFRNSLSTRPTDWRPDREHSGPSIDQSEAALLTPQPNRAHRMFRLSEIHPDNDAARWLPRFCIPPRLPRDRTASILYLKHFHAVKAPGQLEGQVRLDGPASHTRGLLPQK